MMKHHGCSAVLEIDFPLKCLKVSIDNNSCQYGWNSNPGYNYHECRGRRLWHYGPPGGSNVCFTQPEVTLYDIKKAVADDVLRWI